MSQLPIIAGRIAIKALLKLGYRVTRQRGSHVRLHHANKKPITVPDNKVLGKGLIRKILRDVEISVEDFIRLLKE